MFFCTATVHGDTLYLKTALRNQVLSYNRDGMLNPNKDGLFAGSFYWGMSQIDPSSYFKKNLSNINITLYDY